METAVEEGERGEGLERHVPGIGDTKPLQIVSILHGRRDVEQILKGRL